LSIKVGLIGCGGISATHIGAIKALRYPELAAVCDIVPERVQKKGREQGLPEAKRYTDYKELLADPDIDCVVVGTPHYHHAEAAVNAAKAGKHVLVEKPMATTLSDATAMMEAAEENGVILGVVFQHRFTPSMVRVKGAIDGGFMGNPLVAIASVPWWREQSYYDADSWRGTWAQEAGGSLINQGIHTLDRMIWAMGTPISVTAEMAVLNHKIETEDVTSLTVVFESGAIGTLTTTTCAWPSQQERIEIYCEKGSATIIGTELARLETMGPLPELDSAANDEFTAPADFAPGKSCYGTGHVAQLHDFFSAVAEKRQPLVTGFEARKTLSVVLAAYESARSGRRVVL
jgi:UDP-N-acetyl-2-amino-2-deoxyglucuronate dehydrogenase